MGFIPPAKNKVYIHTPESNRKERNYKAKVWEKET